MKLKLSRIILGISVLGGLILVLVLGREQFASHKPCVDAVSVCGKDKGSFDRFFLQGVSWHSYKGGEPLFLLRADKIGLRNCRLGSLIFYNLKEIYVPNLRIELYPITEGVSHSLEYVMKTMGDALTSMGDRAPSNMTRLSDTDSEVVARMVTGKVTLVMHLQSGAQVRITADTAKSQGARQIVLKGHFAGVSADAQHLAGPEAIWLSDWEGLYFPKGYALTAQGRTQEGEETFFTISQAGRFIASPQCPTIEATLREFDIVERMVNAFLSRIIPRFFPYLPYKTETSLDSHRYKPS